MGTFATKKILQGNPSLIPVIAEQSYYKKVKCGRIW